MMEIWALGNMLLELVPSSAAVAASKTADAVSVGCEDEGVGDEDMVAEIVDGSSDCAALAFVSVVDAERRGAGVGHEAAGAGAGADCGPGGAKMAASPPPGFCCLLAGALLLLP